MPSAPEVRSKRPARDRSGASDLEPAPADQPPPYRAIVESLKQGIWVVDHGDRTTFVNTTMAAMLGFEPAEMVGTTPYDFMPAEPEPCESGADDPEHHGIGRQQNIRFLHRDGHDVWTRVSTVPVGPGPGGGGPIPDGPGPATIAMVTEVTNAADLDEDTGQRQRDEALRRERERFRTFVEHSRDLIIVIKSDGTIDHVSATIEEVLGYLPSEVRGRDVGDLLLDESQAKEIVAGSLAPAAEMGTPVPTEVEFRHQDGSLRCFDVVVHNLIDDPRVGGIVVDARDVTNTRRAERRLHRLLEASNDIIVVLKNDGDWFASPAGTRILGHAPSIEPAGGLLSFIHPDDVELAAEAISEVRSGTRDTDDPIEVRARAADGTYRWLEVVARDLTDDPLVRGIVITARDVTARRDADAALSEARKRFAAAFESSPVGIAIAAVDSTLIDCNPEFSRIIGQPRADIIGRNINDFIAPGFQEKIAQAFAERASSPDSALPAPTRFERPNGDPIWLRADAQLVRDDDGKPLYAVATISDVTKQHDAEAALEHSEAWFRALVQNQTDIISVIDSDAIFRYISPNAEHILGFSISEIEGTNALDRIHPDDQDALINAIGAQVEPGTESQPVEYRQLRADGTWIWLEATTSALAPEFEIDGIIVNSRDVSEKHRAEEEQRRSEREFRDAFKGSPIGIAFGTLDGILTWVNTALSAILDMPESELLGAGIDVLDGAGETAADSVSMEALLAGDIPSFTTERRYDHPDGRTVWGLLHVSLVRDGSGAPRQLLSQVEDITENKHRELGHRHAAEHDPLTGAWNRAGMMRLLDEAWENRVADHPLALLFADLDGFKAINDRYGHDAGDEVLEHVASRLRNAVRGGDHVARWGGDEFLVLCPGVRDAAEAAGVAERLREAIAAPFRITVGDVSVGISVGVALDEGHSSQERLLREADAASYKIKLANRDRIPAAEA